MLKERTKVQDITKWHYCVILEKCYQSDIGQYHTYGIRVTGSNYEEIIHDVSVCKETVAWMTELFNLHQLSPVHLKDAVEDLLS